MKLLKIIPIESRNNMSYSKMILEDKIRQFIEEDCVFKDVSSDFIPKRAQSSAKIIAKSEGYIAGLEELGIIYRILGIGAKFLKEDGDSFTVGDIIVEINGNTRQILLGERVGLNLVMHMSGITTTTKKFVEIIKGTGKKIRIAGTRKTVPGMRIFDKKAIELGGGETHRFSLDDMILLKDTHLRYYKGDIKKLLEDVKERASFSKKIEIEIENVLDILTAAENGADIIMCDNMTPAQVGEAIEYLKNNDIRDKVLIEVSGGININNVIDYCQVEPDIISTSELTQNPIEKVDLSLRFE